MTDDNRSDGFSPVFFVHSQALAEARAARNKDEPATLAYAERVFGRMLWKAVVVFEGKRSFHGTYHSEIEATQRARMQLDWMLKDHSPKL